MASLDDVLDGMVNKVKDLLDGKDVKVYKGWPVPEELNVDFNPEPPGLPICHVSIFTGTKHTQNTSRVPRVYEAQTVPIINLTAVVSAPKLRGGSNTEQASGTITFDGSVNDGLRVMVKVGAYILVAMPVMGSTVATVAALVASEINSDPAANLVYIATSTDSVVTVKRKLTGSQYNADVFGAEIGGSVTAKAELRHQGREIEVHVWAYDNESRKDIADLIDVGMSEVNAIPVADGEAARSIFVRDSQNDLETRQGIYRRILVYYLDYPTTKTVLAVQVLDAQVTWGS